MSTYLPEFDPSTWYHILFPQDGTVLCTYNSQPDSLGFTSCHSDTSDSSQQFQIFATPGSNAGDPSFLIRNHLAGAGFYFKALCTGGGFCESNTVAVMSPGNLTDVETTSEWMFIPSIVGNDSSHILNVAKGTSFALKDDDSFIHMIDSSTGNRSTANWQFLDLGPIDDPSFMLTPASESKHLSPGGKAAVVLAVLLFLALAATAALAKMWFVQRSRAPREQVTKQPKKNNDMPRVSQELEFHARQPRELCSENSGSWRSMPVQQFGHVKQGSSASTKNLPELPMETTYSNLHAVQLE